MDDLQANTNKLCHSCHSCQREFSVFIRPHSCELCNKNKLCSNCARKFILSYEPQSYLRLCNKCCDKVATGNQLKNSSKLSKNNSVWSFASSLIGRSSKKQELSRNSKSSKQSKSIKLSSCVSHCCSTQTNKKFADNTHPFKDQAPLFPDNYNLSTPQKKEKQNIIFRHCIDSADDIDPFLVEHDNIHIDDEDNCYHTMHPLSNNMQLKRPKSILFPQITSKNQFALNMSINRKETQHYTGLIDNIRSTLCDCFSNILQRELAQKHIQITSDDNINEEITESGEQINKLCCCITVAIKHRIFKRIRINLLFNENKGEYISMNVLLYDNKSQIWSGVQIVKISEIQPYKIIPKIYVQCNQTLIKKSVTVIGSMSWIIDSPQNDIEFDSNYHPYKGCNISQMISILTQQRFDIIDSYSTVIQQRQAVQNTNEDNNSLKSHRKNQIHSNEKSENHKLYPSHAIAIAIDDEDGGSNRIATKRSEYDGKKVNDKGEIIADRNKENNKKCDNNNVLLPEEISSKQNEIEKSMFEHEIGRMDSMILGLENVLYAIQNKTNDDKQNKMEFDEITSSATSSCMFNTNEINKIKLQIAQHLHNDKNNQFTHVNDRLTTICDNADNNESDVAVSNVIETNKRMIPVCLLCQRCSRTIILCQQIEDNKII